jgi:hypothetical protein
MNKKLLLTLSLTLAAAAFMGNRSIAAPQDGIAAKYLACYALDPTSKKKCLYELAFAAEKDGFREFINNSGLPCDSVEESPEFVETERAYLVKCEPNLQYWMQFNYKTHQWKLIKENK